MSAEEVSIFSLEFRVLYKCKDAEDTRRQILGQVVYTLKLISTYCSVD